MIKWDISRRFSSAASGYRDATPVQERSAQFLFALLAERHLLNPQKNKLQFMRAKPVLLDVGMGSGRLFSFLPQDAWELHGIDFAPGMLAEAQKAWPLAHLICGDAESYEYKPQTYDLVLSNFAVQWFADPLRFVQKIFRALRAEGTFACALPLEGSLKELQDLVRSSSGEELPLYPLPTLQDFAVIAETWGAKAWLWEQKFQAEYSSAFSALKAIKLAGADTYAMEANPLTYTALAKLKRCSGAFTLSYRVLFFIGLKEI